MCQRGHGYICFPLARGFRNEVSAKAAQSELIALRYFAAALSATLTKLCSHAKLPSRAAAAQAFGCIYVQNYQSYLILGGGHRCQRINPRVPIGTNPTLDVTRSTLHISMMPYVGEWGHKRNIPKRSSLGPKWGIACCGAAHTQT